MSPTGFSEMWSVRSVTSWPGRLIEASKLLATTRDSLSKQQGFLFPLLLSHMCFEEYKQIIKSEILVSTSDLCQDKNRIGGWAGFWEGFELWLKRL